MSNAVKMQAKNINFFYGTNHALKNINIDFFEKNITAIIGPSGRGKSTFIRLLNRMHELTAHARVEGEIILDGENILLPVVDAVEVRRKVGMVFQKPNPFAKSIFDNISYGLQVNPSTLLRASGQGRKNFIEQKVEWSLKKAALWDEVKDRLTASALRLSGGQQQRLCIARCLAVEPEVILFDEPCASLDPISTRKIEELMFELKNDYTIAIVTHSMQQAARVSDYTGFFLLGDLVEFGKTQDIFKAPKDNRTEDYITGRFG